MDANSLTRPLRGLEELHDTLSLVLDLIDPVAAGFEHRLVGTGAALAQGVSLPAGDIDILVSRRADVDRFAAALSEYPCLTAPTWLPDAQQYFTNFAVNGIDVGASTVETPVDTDTVECMGRGPWEHFVEVAVGRRLAPAVRLELRLVSELLRDRPDRYVPLIAHLRSHEFDLQLVRRAMADRGIDPALQAQVLGELHI